jgi:uncharacterized membrane protein
MIRFTVPVEIDRPVEEVFAFVTDPARLPEWQANTVSAAAEAEGPMRTGTRLREVHRAPMGRNLESVVEVARYEPNRHFDLRIVDGPMPIHGDFAFAPANGGTRLELTAHGQPGGAMRLAQPLLSRALARQFRRDLARLKERLEAAPAAA